MHLNLVPCLKMKLFFLLLCLAGLLTEVLGLQSCQQNVNCQLPDCLCSSFSHTESSKEYPQIVYFGFDDALTSSMALHYRDLFSPDRKNPNNCPITMSLYIQHDYTNYGIVKEMYDKGMEIGVHSVTHQNIDTEAKLLEEGEQQRLNLHRLGKVPLEEIVGWRSPNLKTAGDVQPDILKKLGYLYDISLTYTRRSHGDKKAFPYTLDYGNPLPCMVKPCPKRGSPHKGFWEVPINSLIDYKSQYPCSYVDGCYNAPEKKSDSFQYLYKNFMDYYEGGREPFGFHMHAAWFERHHNKQAMDQLIKHLVSLPDVYIVTTKQMLDWVRNPVPISELHKLPSWSCSTKPKDILPPLKVDFPQNELIKPAPPNSLAARGPPKPIHVMTEPPRYTTTPQPTTVSPLKTSTEIFVFWQRRTQNPYIPNKSKSSSQRNRASRTRVNKIKYVTLPPRQPIRRITQPTTMKTTTQPPRRFPTTTPAPRRQFQKTKSPIRPVYKTTTSSPRQHFQKPIHSRQNYQTTTLAPRREVTDSPRRWYQTTTSSPHRIFQTTTSPSSWLVHKTTSRPWSIIPVTKPPLRNIQIMTEAPPGYNSSKPARVQSPFAPIFNRGSGLSGGTNREWYNVHGFGSTNSNHCIQGKNCHLPNCFCRTTANPQGLENSDTPQLVYFAFDGPIDGRVYAEYSEMFDKTKKNPDGCPISATLFVAKNGNYMSYLQNLASQGFDIALRGGNRGAYIDWRTMRVDLDEEVRMLKQSIKNVSLYGWRSPEARPLGDSQYQLISSRNLKYDSTMIVRTDAYRGGIPFPYTLDFGWKESCYSPTGCPENKYPGLWEVPISTLRDYKGAFRCTFADGCMNNPTTEEETFQFLLKNFNRHYHSNKAPFGVNLRHLWFSHYLYVPNKAGLRRFIRYLVNLNDVYIVNINQLVDWMKNPTPLSQLERYQPWICPSAYYW